MWVWRFRIERAQINLWSVQRWRPSLSNRDFFLFSISPWQTQDCFCLLNHMSVISACQVCNELKGRRSVIKKPFVLDSWISSQFVHIKATQTCQQHRDAENWNSAPDICCDDADRWPFPVMELACAHMSGWSCFTDCFTDRQQLPAQLWGTQFHSCRVRFDFLVTNIKICCCIC